MSRCGPGWSVRSSLWSRAGGTRRQRRFCCANCISGGIERVNLQQLVQQVLPSLSVLTPPGVMVKVNTGELDITFDTSRAVSLAMVLHELCTNALLHGLAGTGTLTISARRTDQGAIIEVSDEGGTGIADDAEASWMGAVAADEVD